LASCNIASYDNLANRWLLKVRRKHLFREAIEHRYLHAFNSTRKWTAQLIKVNGSTGLRIFLRRHEGKQTNLQCWWSPNCRRFWDSGRTLGCQNRTGLCACSLLSSKQKKKRPFEFKKLPTSKKHSKKRMRKGKKSE
jgi:hypothetical protein